MEETNDTKKVKAEVAFQYCEKKEQKDLGFLIQSVKEMYFTSGQLFEKLLTWKYRSVRKNISDDFELPQQSDGLIAYYIVFWGPVNERPQGYRQEHSIVSVMDQEERPRFLLNYKKKEQTIFQVEQKTLKGVTGFGSW